MSNYLKRLQQSKEERKAGEFKLNEAHAKAEVSKEIASLQGRQATVEAALEDALGATPFNVKRVFELQNEKKEIASQLESATALLTTEFGNE